MKLIQKRKTRVPQQYNPMSMVPYQAHSIPLVPTAEFDKLFLQAIRTNSGVPNEVVEEAEKKLLVLARESRRMFTNSKILRTFICFVEHMFDLFFFGVFTCTPSFV